MRNQRVSAVRIKSKFSVKQSHELSRENDKFVVRNSDVGFNVRLNRDDAPQEYPLVYIPDQYQVDLSFNLRTKSNAEGVDISTDRSD